jgi:hypothetical protein
MNFKKLALAAAVATVPAVGFSVETLEDTDLGSVSGQDGIAVDIAIGTGGIGTSIYVHDTDGLAGVASAPAYSFDGAIVINNMSIAAGTGATIGLEIDAGDNAQSAGAPILNIAVSLPSNLTIVTGSIHVANSQIDDGGRAVDGTTGAILSSTTVILGATTMNIQLGNEAQTGSLAGTDMIVLNSSITSGISISSFSLNDASVGGGSISMATMTVTDSGSTAQLGVDADINVTGSGLQIGLGTLGDGGGMAVEITDQVLGSAGAATLGDISLVGLNLNGTTITISGK